MIRHSHLFLACFLSVLVLTQLTASAGDMWLFVASPGAKPMIAACQLDEETGAFGPIHAAAESVDTGFLAIHPHLPILYAATSEPVAQGPNGAVRAYQINPGGKLKLLNQTSTRDQGTTHIAVNQQGTQLAVCHYGGQGTCTIGIEADGRLTDDVASYVHVGASVTPRQERPHPHGVAYDSTGEIVFVADLGNDHVEVLHQSGPQALERLSFWQAPPGSGPRHVALHPNGKWLYCINELSNTIAVLEYDAQAKSLREVEIVATLPADFQQVSYTSEVVVHPSGQFLYGSNRGHESTVVYAIDPPSGKLTVVQHEPTQGKHPRFVGLDASGRHYLAANMNSDNIVSFHVDAATGRLRPSGHQLAISKPMCVAFWAGE